LVLEDDRTGRLDFLAALYLQREKKRKLTLYEQLTRV
jgi:hypothetical protein